MKSRKLRVLLTLIFTILFCCIGYLTFENTENDTSLNLANINYIGPEDTSQDANVIFYRDNTKKSQKEIPLSYTLDKFTFHSTEYRNLNNLNNDQIHQHPERHSRGHLMTFKSLRVLSFLVGYVVLTVICSYILTLLVLKLCF